MAKTEVGESQADYLKYLLKQSKDAGQAAIEAGYPGVSTYTDAYYRGIPNLQNYGTAEQMQALQRAGDLYGAYGAAGGYDKTNFADIEKLYAQAGQYDPTNYTDVERMYRQAGDYDAAEFSGIQRQLDRAGDYDTTNFSDLERKSLRESNFNPAEFDRADYTTKNIKQRMSPYEELVAKRATDRLQRQFDEAAASRDLEAARAGSFGGSGSAVAQELARRNMQEQMADVNAQSLQSAYEAAVGLYGKEYADNMAAQQAEEQSRQFGENLGMQGIQQAMAARQAEEQSKQYGSQAGLQALQQKFAAQQAAEASRQFGQQAEFQGLEGLMAARNAEEASRQFGAQMGMQGVAGQLSAREQTAAQIAAAKEAEFKGLAGQGESARQQALMAEQRRNMYTQYLAALQSGGQQQEAYNLAQRMYPLQISQMQAGIGGISTQPLNTYKQPDTPWWQTALGVGAGAAGIASGFGFKFADGGLVFNGGGLADIEPEYYDKYER